MLYYIGEIALHPGLIRTNYTIKTIRNGKKERKLYIPSDKVSKKNLRQMAVALAKRIDKGRYLHDHGFRAGRSPVTCAASLRGRRYYLSADLQDCFPSTTREMVKRGLGLVGASMDDDLLEIITPDGTPQQGIPTSPILVSIALKALDMEIVKRWPGVLYSRYADDLNFATDSLETAREIRRELPGIAERLGWKVNSRKWHMTDARVCKPVICGVVLDGDSTRPTREFRKILRAAEHAKSNSYRTRGLRGWSATAIDSLPPHGRPVQRDDKGWDITYRGIGMRAVRIKGDWYYEAVLGPRSPIVLTTHPRKLIRSLYRAYHFDGGFMLDRRDGVWRLWSHSSAMEAWDSRPKRDHVKSLIAIAKLEMGL
jgi:hypothetical protein